MSGCTGGDPSVEHSQFQQQIVHAVCDTVQTCCTAAERGFNAMNCVDKVADAFTTPLSDGTLYYDSTLAGRCLQQVTQAAEACGTVDVTPCYDAFVGTVPPGGACSVIFDCAPGPDGFAICNYANVCEQPARGAYGQPCSYTCIDGPGLPQCHAPQGMASAGGVACHSSNGLVCVIGPTGAATCEPQTADCTQNPTGACPQGQLCDMVSKQCYTPVPIGGSCAQVPCGPGGYCAGGVCTPQKPNAAQCADKSECASNDCEKGLCVPFSQAAQDWCGESTAGQ